MATPEPSPSPVVTTPDAAATTTMEPTTTAPPVVSDPLPPTPSDAPLPGPSPTTPFPQPSSTQSNQGSEPTAQEPPRPTTTTIVVGPPILEDKEPPPIVSVITITTVVPHTTMVSGTVTTYYETLTSTSTTTIHHHNEPTPKSSSSSQEQQDQQYQPTMGSGISQEWPNRRFSLSSHGLQAWQIATIVLAVVVILVVCGVLVLTEQTRRRHSGRRRSSKQGIHSYDPKGSQGGEEEEDEKKQGDVLGADIAVWNGEEEEQQQQQQQRQQQGQAMAGLATVGQEYRHQETSGMKGDPQGYDGGLWSAPVTTSHTMNRQWRMDAGHSEQEYHGVYGGMVMSPQQGHQGQQQHHMHGQQVQYGTTYLDEEYPRSTEAYCHPRPQATRAVPYPIPPSHQHRHQGQYENYNRTMALGMDGGDAGGGAYVNGYMNGYGHGYRNDEVYPVGGESVTEYLSVSRRESHDGTWAERGGGSGGGGDSHTVLERTSSQARSGVGYNSSQDHRYRPTAGSVVRAASRGYTPGHGLQTAELSSIPESGPVPVTVAGAGAGTGTGAQWVELNGKVELYRKSPQALIHGQGAPSHTYVAFGRPSA
ncbi:hypothetical protein BGZ94_001526 [Podila epigama]|nr:hypothetical protein BGZ94_001526 [Podila epigama]